MTPTEALDKLRTAAIRKHVIVTNVIGPSHGDPGGYILPDPSKSCKGWQWDRLTTTGFDLSKCDCPAGRHNEIVEEALATLKSALP